MCCAQAEIEGLHRRMRDDHIVVTQFWKDRLQTPDESGSV